MPRLHHYSTGLEWTGNKGEGTAHYRSYERSHTIHVEGKAIIQGSSDPAFAGDPSKYNPEELLLASLSACHMLWYLHLCADNGIIVTAYTDAAKGVMEENENGGRFVEVTLYPKVTIKDASQAAKATALHTEAHAKCFIANSCNFPVKHEPSVTA
ncbi:MAG: OsmC family protein [Ferruginibacter sp.]